MTKESLLNKIYELKSELESDLKQLATEENSELAMCFVQGQLDLLEELLKT
jgi:hypothetical protein